LLAGMPLLTPIKGILVMCPAGVLAARQQQSAGQELVSEVL